MTDDPEHEHEYVRVIIRMEPIQPRWIRALQAILTVALFVLITATVIALVGRWPWVEVLSRTTNVVTMILLVTSIVLMARVGFHIRRDRQEMARLETRLYKTYLDLKVENDRAGRPPLPPPPELW
jgi:hypothetical protein